MIGGTIGSSDHPEILVTTYSGKIFGLTTKPAGQLDATHGDAAVAKLKTEIQALEDELKKDYTTPFAGDTLTPMILSVNHR